MRATHYLIYNRRGVARVTKRRPDLSAGEVAVRLTVEIDDRHFRMPTADVEVTIGESHLIQPEVLVEIEDPDQGDSR